MGNQQLFSAGSDCEPALELSPKLSCSALYFQLNTRLSYRNLGTTPSRLCRVSGQIMHKVGVIPPLSTYSTLAQPSPRAALCSVTSSGDRFNLSALCAVLARWYSGLTIYLVCTHSSPFFTVPRLVSVSLSSPGPSTPPEGRHMIPYII